MRAPRILPVVRFAVDCTAVGARFVRVGVSATAGQWGTCPEFESRVMCFASDGAIRIEGQSVRMCSGVMALLLGVDPRESGITLQFSEQAR